MLFTIDPTPDETQRAVRAMIDVRVPTSGSTVRFSALYVAVVIAAFVLVPASPLMAMLVGLCSAVGGALLTRAETLRRARSLRGVDPHERERHYIELSPERVRAWCEHVDARYPWEEFTTVTENGEFYLLMRGAGGGIAIPKRVIDDATDRELRARLREWAPDRGASLARETVSPAHG